MIISSRQHPLIKLARALHGAKGRRENGLFLVEGRNAVEAAMESDWALRELLCEESEVELSALASARGLEVRRAPRELLAYASDAQTALPLAIGELPSPREMVFGARTLVLDGIADPGNAGTLWRAADAAGASAVLSLGGADPFSPKVVRSAAGSLFHLPPLRAENDEALEALRAQNVPLILAQAHGAANCFEFDWPARAALVLGHETRGISPQIARAADFAVTIPGFGRAESLNVAMAGTVLLFAWAQQTRQI